MEFVITGTESRPMVRGPIPGPAAKAIVADDARWIATTTKAAPIAIRAAKGSTVLTVDGDLMLDFASGVGVLNVGHAHPRVVEAVREQAGRFTHFAGTDYYYEVQVALAKRLAKLVPGASAQKVFFTNSGTESNEAAMKLAAWSSRRHRFLAFQRAFHGRTLGSLGLTNSKTVHRERFDPVVGVHHVPFPNPYRNVFGVDGYEDPDALVQRTLAFLEEVLDSALPPAECAAMFVEPLQGEAGYHVPPAAFYPALKKVLDQHGILLVADEVQTGLGRTGRLFAMEHWNVAPSVTTMAKALGSGLPIGAAVFDARLDFGVSGAHSNTFGGNPVAAAAALATLDVIEKERLVDCARERGRELEARLREAAAKHEAIGDVRGLGLMRAVELVKDRRSKTPDKETRDRVIVEACKRGLILLPCGRSVVRFIPPLVVTPEQVQGGCDVFDQALAAATS